MLKGVCDRLMHEGFQVQTEAEASKVTGMLVLNTNLILIFWADFNKVCSFRNIDQRAYRVISYRGHSQH